jgi:cation:H+ antiporter
MLWSSIGLVLLGLVLLVAGGEALVRGATGIALLARLTPTVVGLTVVAAGTSMPELVVSVQAALRESPELSVGNVVGSNIFNIAAILGLAALVSPLRIQGNTVRLEWPVMFVASCQLYLLARDGRLDRLEGGFLFVGLIVFVAYSVWIARRELEPVERDEIEASLKPSHADGGPRAWLWNVVLVLVGVGLLAGGANALVAGAATLARAAGVEEVVIGLTVVAAGTSLPELAASVVAAWRGNDDIAVANVIGSNVFNALGIIGATAIVYPLPVASGILTRDAPWMVALAAALLPLMWTGRRITRVEGGLLVAAFVTYVAVLLRLF